MGETYIYKDIEVDLFIRKEITYTVIRKRNWVVPNCKILSEKVNLMSLVIV